MIEKIELENRPIIINGKEVDRWFAIGWSDTAFWKKKAYAVEYFADRGMEAV